MKRIPISLLAFAVVLAVAMWAPTMKHHFTVVPVVHAQSGCTNSTLSGNYGFIFSGFQRTHNKSVPFYGAGLAVADGAGNLSATFAASINGISSTNNTYSATYTVNSDCTVSTTATPGSGGDNFMGVIVGGGSEALETDISDPDTLNLDLRKQ
jgi:hypothetical protein